MSKLNISALVKKPNLKNKKTLLAIFIIIFLIVGGWFVLVKKNSLNNSGKVYAEAAGHKIYKKEVDELINGDQGITEHEAAQVLADKYMTEALGKEQGVTVSDKELIDQYGKGIKKQKTENKYAYQNKLNQLYFLKLRYQSSGIYKGKFLMANFSRHIPFKSPLLKEDKAADPLLGNPKVIRQDKKYAQDLITGLYNDINSKKITFDQAIKIEQNDPVVGTDVYPTLSHSGSFDSSKEGGGPFNISALKESGQNIQPGQMTKPFAVKVSDSVDGDSTTESYFLVIRLDSASGGNNVGNYQQYIDKAKERLGYGVYV